MTNRILIINYCLNLGGGEKLILELSKFCKKKDIKLTVLIPNRLEKEFYDDILENLGVKVIRVYIGSFKDIIKTKHIKSIYWYFILRFFINYKFNTVHIFNLVIVDRFYNRFNHIKRFFWHITNSIQYKDSKYPFNERIFSNKKDTIVYINKYQIKELEKDYGNIHLNMVNFKLFLA